FFHANLVICLLGIGLLPFPFVAVVISIEVLALTMRMTSLLRQEGYPAVRWLQKAKTAIQAGLFLAIIAVAALDREWGVNMPEVGMIQSSLFWIVAAVTIASVIDFGYTYRSRIF